MGLPLRKGGVQRPRLVASLLAWAVVATLLLLHRSHADVQTCLTATATSQAAGEGGPPSAEAAAREAAAALQAALAGAQAQAAGPYASQYANVTREQIEALIRAPVGLHGRMQKGGLPANFAFVRAHLTDTDPHIREEGIPATMGPPVFRWFAHAYT